MSMDSAASEAAAAAAVDAAAANAGIYDAAAPASLERRVENVQVKDNSAEALRGVAALTVFVCHFLVFYFPGSFDTIEPGMQTTPVSHGLVERIAALPLLSVLWNGHLAVCIFFVLSGYVLSQPYYRGNAESLKARAVRRYLRLTIPIAASIALGYLFMRSGWLLTRQVAQFTLSDQLQTYWAFPASLKDAVRDALVGTMFWGRHGYNPPLWTMKIEFIGSLLIFAFHTMLPRSKERHSVYYLSFAAVILLFFVHEAIYYYAFLLGSLLWRIPRLSGRTATWAILLLGLALGSYQRDGMYLHLPHPYFMDARSMYSVIGGFLIFWAVRSDLFSTVVESPAMIFLGRVSFSVYLLHFLLLGSFSCWLYLALRGHLDSMAAGAVNFLCSAALLLAIAPIFEKWVDRTGIKLSKLIA